MKKCKKCKNTMFNIDVDTNNLCKACSLKELEKLIRCKECKRSIKVVYALPGEICPACDKKIKADTKNRQADKSAEIASLITTMLSDEEQQYNQQSEKSKSRTSDKNNTKSIVGLVLSIISIFGIGLAGIVGLVLGLLALTEIKHTGDNGRGLAIAAIIIGSIWGILKGILGQLIEAGILS